MTTNQENRLSMILAVLICMDNNRTQWQNTPAINQIVTDIKGKVLAIRGTHITQSQKTTGTTRNKKQQRTALINALTNIIGPLSAYARQQQNNELLVDVRKTKSQMERMRDNNLLDFALNTYNLAQTYLANLQTDYGVSTSDISNLLTQQETFDNLISAPRTRKTITKNATTRLVDLLDTTNTSLDTLDDLMLPYRNKNIDFYTIYHNARNIIDLHGKVKHRNNNTEKETNTPTISAANDVAMPL